jgi:SH3-like domain-containing protein
LPARFQVQSGAAAIGFALLMIAGSLSLSGCKAHADAQQSYDTPSGLAVPRWAALRAKEVNARNGPSTDNAVLWTYKQPGLPVQIISETRDWRLICDPQGGVAWVSRTLLTNRKQVLTPAGQKVQMRAEPNETSVVKAVVQPHALVGLDRCDKNWCRVSIDGVTGWLPQARLWGAQDGQVCQRPDLLTGLGAPPAS